MYEVLDKDKIIFEILPHLSVAKRGYVSKSDLSEVIQCILYKLKTGCQWHMLPVSSFFTGRVLHYKTGYGHFRKWSRNGEWEKVWGIVLHRYRSFLDMSSVELDGGHTTALRGQGIPLVISTPVSGSHNNVYNISEVLSELFSGLTPSALSVSGLFLNADAGFDTEQFRRGCYEHEVFPNVAFKNAEEREGRKSF